MGIQPLIFAKGSPPPPVVSGAQGLSAAEEAAIAVAQRAKAAAAATGTGGLSLFAAAKRRAKGGQRAALRAYSTSMLHQSEATAGAVVAGLSAATGPPGSPRQAHDAPHGEEGDSVAEDGDIDASQWGGFVPGGPTAEPTAPREGVSACAGRGVAMSPAQVGSATKAQGSLAPPPSDINAVLMQERERRTALVVAAAQAAAAPPRWGPFHSIIAIRPTGWAQQTGGPGGGGGGGGKRGSEAGDASEILDILASIAGGDGRRGAVGGASAAAPSSFNRRDGAEDLRPGVIAPEPISVTSSSAGGADGSAFSDAGLLRDMEAQQRESNSRHNVTEQRQAPGECHVVLLGPDGESARAVGPRPGPSASTTGGGAGPGGLHQLYSVRLTRQTRLGGARCHATAGATQTPMRQPGQPLPPGGVTLLSAPYSEHSSFGELRQCVSWARPARVVPTANCRSREDAERLVALLTSGQSESLKQGVY